MATKYIVKKFDYETETESVLKVFTDKEAAREYARKKYAAAENKGLRVPQYKLDFGETYTGSDMYDVNWSLKPEYGKGKLFGARFWMEDENGEQVNLYHVETPEEYRARVCPTEDDDMLFYACFVEKPHGPFWQYCIYHGVTEEAGAKFELERDPADDKLKLYDTRDPGHPVLIPGIVVDWETNTYKDAVEILKKYFGIK